MMAARISLAALLTLALSAAAQAHPFHVTMTEAEWNPKTKSLEVSMRVNPLDVERVLRAKWKRNVELVADDKKMDAAVFEYLQKQLVLATPDKKRLKPKWVGMEVKVNRAWLYFEYPMKAPPKLLRVEHRVFHELESDQVNTLMLKVDGRRMTRHFTRFKNRHELPFVAAEKRAANERPEGDFASESR